MSVSQNFPDEGPSLSLNFAGAEKLDSRITFTRSSTGTYLDRSGLVVTAPANSPRFDHSYNGSNVESLGLLIEESRTNLLLRSQDLLTAPNASASGLSNFFTSAIDALPSPSGSTNETVKFVSTSTTSEGLFLRQTGLSLTATTYTVSMYVYVPTQSGITNWGMVWDFADSVDFVEITNQTIFDRWVRISGTLTLTSTRSFLDFNVRINNVAPTAAGFTIYAWGVQVEAGAFPTSYIPTVASTVTRSADNASITGTNFSSWYNSTEYTLFSSARTFQITSYPAVVSINDGTINNVSSLFFDPSVPRGAAYWRNSGSQYGFNGATLSSISNTNTKMILAVKTNDWGFAQNGSSQAYTTGYGVVPTGVTRLTIGNGDTALNGTISQLIYYPRRLTNTQLQNLTK